MMKSEKATTTVVSVSMADTPLGAMRVDVEAQRVGLGVPAVTWQTHQEVAPAVGSEVTITIEWETS